MFTSVQKQKQKQDKPQPSHWQSTKDELVQISKINKDKSTKQILYYTPKDIFTDPQGRIFHPCDWSIQDFQIGRYLGKGKYGHVYLARERRKKMIVAIKVITKKQIVNSEIIFQLRREIQIHSHLNHPNILKMHGFFYDEKKIYIIIDYAPYGQLYKMLQKDGKFSQQKSACYIYQMLQALNYLHSNNIIHRDIKPENILLSINDEIKLTDLGWSVHVGDKHKRRQTYCGTPDYICPEIALKKDYDFKLDMWCLGVLTFQFNAGFPPFHDAFDRRDLIRLIREVSFKCPDHFSPELRDFIGKLMRLKPEERMTADVAEKHPWIKKYHLDLKKKEPQSKEQPQTKEHPQSKEQKDVEI